MKAKCKVCRVYCEYKACVFEHNGDENICPFYARYLDLSEHDKQIRADAIEECIAITRKGLKELCQSPYAERHYPIAKECFGIVDDLIVKKDLKKLREQI